MSRTSYYVDGFNLYHAIKPLACPELKWLASGVRVVESRFLKSNRFCQQFSRYCSFREEKQTDVALAVKVLRDAQEGSMERAILVTADSDQIPLVRAVRESFPSLSIEIAAPPGRMREARELCSVASRFSEISAGRLRTCLLPRNVVNEKGRTVAVCPARYLPRSPCHSHPVGES